MVSELNNKITRSQCSIVRTLTVNNHRRFLCSPHLTQVPTNQNGQVMGDESIGMYLNLIIENDFYSRFNRQQYDDIISSYDLSDSKFAPIWYMLSIFNLISFVISAANSSNSPSKTRINYTVGCLGHSQYYKVRDFSDSDISIDRLNWIGPRWWMTMTVVICVWESLWRKLIIFNMRVLSGSNLIDIFISHHHLCQLLF